MTLDLHDAPEPGESIIGPMSARASDEVKERRREYIKAALAEGHTADAVAEKLRISKERVQQIARQNAFSERDQSLPPTVSSNGGLDPVDQSARMRALWCDVLSAALDDYNIDYWVAVKIGKMRPDVVLSNLTRYLASRDGQHVQSLAGVLIPARAAVELVKLPRREFRNRFLRQPTGGAE